MPVLAGCVAEGTDFEALPFVRIDRTEPGRLQVDVPPVLLTVDTAPDSSRKALAARDAAEPAAEGEPGSAEERDYLVRFPYPFGLWIGQGRRHTWSLTGFLLDDGGDSGPLGRALSPDEEVRDDLVPTLASDPASGGLRAIPLAFSWVGVDHGDLPDATEPGLDEDISLSPFFMAGYGDRDEDDYLAVAPFGGVTKGILGKERITWYGFPYPLYAHVVDRQYDSHHILFPLINWVDGPQNSGFRVLPFFAHYERRGLAGNPIYDKTWVLWPLFTWSRSGLNEPVPTETLFLFPFFGRTWSDDYAALTVLWPLFKYQEWRERDGDRWQLRAPFPFVILESGPGRWRFDLWPLMGFKHREGFDRHFALWPIWRYEDLETPEKTFSGQWLLPLFWRTRWEEKETGKVKQQVRVFPLVHYRRGYDGSVDVATLSPWPYEDEGWDRVLAPFLRLYRYHRDPDGGVEHQALLGLFSYRDRPAAPEQGRLAYTRLSLLFGLFQYRNRGGEQALRFLWLPELPTWGAAE